MFDRIKAASSELAGRIADRRFCVRYRVARLCRAWAYFRGNLNAEDAQRIMLNCEYAAGWYPLLVLTVEDTLQQAREVFANHPDLPRLINDGFKNVIPILDNKNEFEDYKRLIRTKDPVNIGIRIAAEEEPTFDFYTSRLGIRSRDILEFYVDKIKGNERFQLKMLHFFMNKGIKDDIYYWSELNKVINLYCQLKKICPELDSINIGGGFPIKHSLGFEYDISS